MQMTCLFCRVPNPTSIEHIIPESLGNDDLVLRNDVCDLCNAHFAKIENFVLQRTSLAFWRAFLGTRTKKGKLPSVNLSQPDKHKGIFPDRHPQHSDGIGFSAHQDGSCSVEISNESTVHELLKNEREQFQFVMTPKLLHEFGRFLCKIGVELICSIDRSQAREKEFEAARTYARYGSMADLWPIFHFSSGNIQDIRRLVDDETEEVDCFDYSVLEVREKYTLLRFKIGTDNWIICLNEQWPTPEIRCAFPENDIQMIWYPRESFRK